MVLVLQDSIAERMVREADTDGDDLISFEEFCNVLQRLDVEKKMSIRNKEINDFRKKINSIEARLLDKRLERHAILKNAKIELIELPMLRGRMNDINEEDPNTQTQRTAASEDAATGISGTTGTNADSLNTVSTADQAIMFEKEARIKINYKQLDTDFLNVNCSFKQNFSNLRSLFVNKFF